MAQQLSCFAGKSHFEDLYRGGTSSALTFLRMRKAGYGE